MNGSIRFNDDINIEVAVDPTAEEGARLTGAKNLVDGQELGTGGGADLPVVTEADAGKVLAVNASGEWAAESPYVIVTATFSEDVWTLDKTAGEIKAIIESRKMPVLRDSDQLSGIFNPLLAFVPIGDDNSALFTFFFADEFSPRSFSADSYDDYPVSSD